MFKKTVPILRSFDEAMARAFYVDFLGFEVQFEHRFSDDLPLYMGLVKDGCEIHVSEHFGDAAPGCHVRLEMTGLADYVEGLRNKAHKFARPGNPKEQPWGILEIAIADPFGNRITFVETIARQRDN
ncbi:MAG: glyoxalase superfamily protein [Pseudomonadota bacterium]